MFKICIQPVMQLEYDGINTCTLRVPCGSFDEIGQFMPHAI